MGQTVAEFSDRDIRQTDVTALPYTKFREVHNYDLTTCQITSIVGWGFGDLLPVDINPSA